MSARYLSMQLIGYFQKESQIMEVSNPFLQYSDGAKRCRCYTFKREEIISVDDKMEGEYDDLIQDPEEFYEDGVQLEF